MNGGSNPPGASVVLVVMVVPWDAPRSHYTGSLSPSTVGTVNRRPLR